MKKIILLTLCLFANVAHAANTEAVSLRQAEDILKYRVPTRATDIVGKWKKVLHGPTDSRLGQYNSDGIVEGAESKVMTITISGSNLSDWIPQEASTVFVAIVKDIMTPALPDRKDIAEAPRLQTIPPGSISQSGDAILFSIKTSYKYKSARQRTNYHRPIPGLLLEFSTSETVKDDDWLFIEINYSCGLQAENKDRLICNQNVVRGQNVTYGDDHKKAVSYYLNFPNMIAFERVK
jgi:hypothetical protein